LEQVRLDTEGIRSLTLSNPFPPQADWREQITAVEVMLNQFFQLCVDHEKCNATFPKVGEAFYKLADQLNSKPVVADVSDLQTGRRYKVQVDGDVLINITLGIIDSGSSEYMGYIPRMVYQATAGKLDTLEKLAAQSMGGFDMSQAGLSSLYSCHDGPPPTEEAVLSAVNSLEPALAAFFKHTFEDNLAVCTVWGAPDVYLSPTDYPAISTPTLLITSGQSWQIPRPWVDQVAKMLPSSQVVMLPGGGMWSAFSREYWGCVNPMVSGFVVDPAAEISAQCAAEAPEITWITLP
jgi:pimeloyl-ACP methyl ester carboxylesterase